MYRGSPPSLNGVFRCTKCMKYKEGFDITNAEISYALKCLVLESVLIKV